MLMCRGDKKTSRNCTTCKESRGSESSSCQETTITMCVAAYEPPSRTSECVRVAQRPHASGGLCPACNPMKVWTKHHVCHHASPPLSSRLHAHLERQHAAACQVIETHMWVAQDAVVQDLRLHIAALKVLTLLVMQFVARMQLVTLSLPTTVCASTVRQHQRRRRTVQSSDP